MSTTQDTTRRSAAYYLDGGRVEEDQAPELALSFEPLTVTALQERWKVALKQTPTPCGCSPWSVLPCPTMGVHPQLDAFPRVTLTMKEYLIRFIVPTQCQHCGHKDRLALYEVHPNAQLG